MLDEKDAFRAMVLFLEKFYERTNSDDVGTLLSDLQILEDETTADPAAWYDWMQCLSIIKNNKNLS
ncbi:hypothetical protein A0J52_01715 [Clostridium sporogenes]|uniref:hypothetical protein n=1 Tax=Clostridium sporogenes TaxID=1509 RepID=UPI0007800879|nr:hypothetical protein [Clostridium sporogenes]KYN78027.1 hypothetical protein A0J52_01715 [Clostridium sporogenes]MCW6076134.1 hypothetical protein [Clostridium sporogenes]MCW6111065.1 hypothetical protein [Clostridium sporogenes]